MLPKTHRLARKELTPTSPVKLLHTPYFSVKVWNNDKTYHRFACVISKKIDPRAVVRNTLRRRLAKILSTLPQHPVSSDCVFMVKKPAILATDKELEVALTTLSL